ncbi:MAG TPA: BON domain-containing protein [Terracidiphilus sp.]|nr:BON domain-containing protein [Terracidiphilus sp.]
MQKLILAAAVAALTALPGCRSQHPEVKSSVYATLSQHGLASVEVFEDRGNGVITLRGIVGNTDSRGRAEQLVQQAAPGYTVKNQLTVNSTGITATAKPAGNSPAGSTTPSATATAAAQHAP